MIKVIVKPIIAKLMEISYQEVSSNAVNGTLGAIGYGRINRIRKSQV
jgi:hypothetical protein